MTEQAIAPAIQVTVAQPMSADAVGRFVAASIPKQKPSSRHRHLFPVYAKKRVHKSLVYYYVFLNRSDYIQVASHSMSLNTNQASHYHDFLNGKMPMATFDEIDMAAVRFFNRVKNHIADSFEVWKRWDGLWFVSYYFNVMDKGKDKEQQLSFDSCGISFYRHAKEVKPEEIGHDAFRYVKVEDKKLAESVRENVMEYIEKFEKYFMPSDTGYADRLAGKKQLPKKNKK